MLQAAVKCVWQGAIRAAAQLPVIIQLAAVRFK